MRILVVSDTHRQYENLETVIARVMPDKIFHAGDAEGGEDYIEAVCDCPAGDRERKLRFREHAAR